MAPRRSRSNSGRSTRTSTSQRSSKRSKNSALGASSERLPIDRIVVDSVHGAIELTRIERQVVDTATFQRLRHLKQLGLGHVTYPNATHTRFAHSLGVLAIMSQVLRVSRVQLGLDDGAEQDLRLAALLHDIGHYPYSHLMEAADKVVLIEERVRGGTISRDSDPYPDHEEVGKLIVNSQKDMIDAIGGSRRARQVAELFTRSKAADAQLSKLIHSSLDMDRLDYLVRDTRSAGVPYGEVDIQYLLHNLRASPSGMVGIDYKAITAAEQFMLARYFMHKAVYFHKTTFGLEEAFRQLIRRCRDQGKFNLPAGGTAVRELVCTPNQLLNFTDHFLDAIARQAITDSDSILSRLASSIVHRKPPKLLREECLLVDGASEAENQFNRGTVFLRSCQDKLERLARDNRMRYCQILWTGRDQAASFLSPSTN